MYKSRLVIARLLTPRKPWRPLTYHGEIFRPPKYISVCCLCSEVVSLLWLRITKACTMHVMFSLSKHSPLFQCQRASSSLADVSIYMTIAKNHEGGRVFPTATWHPLILLGAGRREGGGRIFINRPGASDETETQELVSWCFKPSQPQRNTSGLNTNFTITPS